MPLKSVRENSKDLERVEYDTVLMEREYLRAWKTFREES